MTLGQAPNAVRHDVAPFIAALDREDFRAELERLCVSEWRWGALQETRVRVLRTHTHRCTFEIDLETSERGWRRVIAKAYEDDRSDVFHIMSALRSAGFGPEAEWSIPEPLAWLPAFGVRLDERVEGPSATEVLWTGSRPEQIAAAGRSARWLARFHTTAPRSASAFDLDRQAGRHRQWTEQVSALGEPFAGRCRLLLRELEAAQPLPGSIESCAGHGSYIPDHVILSDARTVIIDLDEYDVADPARDLAWFTVSMQRRAWTQFGDLHALDEAVDEFLRVYVAEAAPGATENLSFYTASEYLHRAKRDLVSQARGPQTEKGDIMLDEGLLALA